MVHVGVVLEDVVEHRRVRWATTRRLQEHTGPPRRFDPRRSNAGAPAAPSAGSGHGSVVGRPVGLVVSGRSDGDRRGRRVSQLVGAHRAALRGVVPAPHRRQRPRSRTAGDCDRAGRTTTKHPAASIHANTTNLMNAAIPRLDQLKSPNRCRDLLPPSPARPIQQTRNPLGVIAGQPQIHGRPRHLRERGDLLLLPPPPPTTIQFAPATPPAPAHTGRLPALATLPVHPPSAPSIN